MRFDLNALYLTLLPAEPLTIVGGVGTEIRVLEGRVWLTEENVPEDIFLYAGASYTLRSSGRAVLDADALARLVVESPVTVGSPSWLSALGYFGHRVATLLHFGHAPAAPVACAAR